MTSEFAFKWRVIEPWHEPDAKWTFSRAANIFTWADMLDPKPSSPLGRWVEQVRVRDYFDAENRERTEASLQACETELTSLRKEMAR